MRVSHVITRLIVGGAQENTSASVLGLHQKPDVEVDLISGLSHGPEGSLESAFQQNPNSPQLTIVPELVRAIHPLKDFIAFRKLVKLFQKSKPDIVHTHSGKAGILGRVAARCAGVSVIVHTIHGPSFGSFQGNFANVIFRSAEKFSGKYTTHFISVAHAMTEQYLAAGIGRRENYTRIFSGFSLPPFLEATNDLSLRQKLGIGQDDFVVGKIARLFELKGHDDLFAVAADLEKRCPRIKFLFVGDGKWRERFEQKAQASGLQKHFVFAGLVPPSDVSRYIGVMDVLVHLSRREGLPRTLPQALAAAKPVIAYDCDGAKEICLPNETGFLIPAGDTEELKEKILLLANDAELRERLGQRGQQLVKEKFSVEQMVESIYQLYLQLIAQQIPRAA